MLGSSLPTPHIAASAPAGWRPSSPSPSPSRHRSQPPAASSAPSSLPPRENRLQSSNGSSAATAAWSCTSKRAAGTRAITTAASDGRTCAPSPAAGRDRAGLEADAHWGGGGLGHHRGRRAEQPDWQILQIGINPEDLRGDIRRNRTRLSRIRPHSAALSRAARGATRTSSETRRGWRSCFATASGGGRRASRARDRRRRPRQGAQHLAEPP